MKRLSFLILSATILLLAACGKKGGNTGLMVPKDAVLVVHINSPALTSKLTWEEIRQSNWFKEMFEKQKDSLAKELLADPASSGMDLKKDFVYFVKKQGRGWYSSFQGSLSDDDKFEQLLKELAQKDGFTPDVKKDGDFSYLETGREGVVVWNGSGFAYLYNADMPRSLRRSGGVVEPHKFQNDSLRVFGKQSLTLKPENNLDKDSRFADLVKDGSDLHIWSSAEGVRGDVGPMASLSRMNLVFDDNVAATSCNFGNGQITAKTKVFCNPELTKLLEKYKAGPVNADVINRIPAGDVAFVMAFNYPPQGLFEFLRVLGLDGWANMGLARMNYSVEEFVKANKGDVLFAISDIGKENTTDTLQDQANPMIPDMKVLFATSVNDKAAFEKLMTLLGGIVQNKAGEFLPKIPQISYRLDNNWFVASNVADQTNNFLAGNKSNHAFAGKITGQPFGLYVDLQKVIAAVSSRHVYDSASKEAADATVKMWQDVVGTGGEFRDKTLHYNFEINLTDKNTNSLKQLNQYFDKMAAIKKAEDARLKSLPPSVPYIEPAPAPAPAPAN